VLFFLVQTYSFPTFLGERLAAWLSGKTGAKVEIKSVSIDFFSRLGLHGIFIGDLKGDTLLYADRIQVKINEFSYSNQILGISELNLEKSRVKLARYVDEDRMNFQFLIDAFASNDTLKDTTKSAWIIDPGIWKLDNIHFSFRDFRDTSRARGMNFADLDVKNIFAEFADFELFEDSLKVAINTLTCNEKCGLELRAFSGNFTYTETHLQLDSFRIKTAHSDLAGNLGFHFADFSAFDDFEKRVKLKAVFDKSELFVSDIGYFAPDLLGYDRTFTLKGKVSGPVANLKAREMEIDYENHTRIRGDFDISGLPDIDETYLLLDLKELATRKSDIETLPDFPLKNKNTLKLSDNIGLLGNITYKGRISGYYYDLVSDGSISTALGKLATNLKLRVDPESSEISYSGKISSANFQVGKFIGSEKILGAITMNVSVKGSGIKINDLKADVEGAIDKLEFNDYSYTGIKINGRISKRVFDGSLVVLDPNVFLDFEGQVNFSESPTRLDFLAKIPHINLKELNFLKTTEAIHASTDLEIRLTANNIDDAQGIVMLKGIRYYQGDNHYDLKDFLLRISEDDKKRAIRISSEIVEAFIVGDYKLEELGGSFYDIMSLYVTSLLPEDYFKKNQKFRNRVREDFEYNFVFKNTEPITRIFFPDLIIAHKTILRGKYNSRKEYFDIKGSSPLIRFAGTQVVDWALNAKTGMDAFELNVGCKAFNISDTLRAENLSINSRLYNDSMDLVINWKNKAAKRNQGNIHSVMDLRFYPKIITWFIPSDSALVIEDSVWQIHPDNRIVIDTGKISITDLVFSQGKQEMKVFGTIAKGMEEHLQLAFKNFNLSTVNPLTHKAGITWRGGLTGTASFTNLFDPTHLIFSTALDFSNFWINKEEIGSGSVIGIYDKKKDVITLNGAFKKPNSEENSIGFTGKYYPAREKDNLDMEAELSGFGLRFFEPYLEGVFSTFRGYANGKFNIRGEINHPKISGFAIVQVKNMKIDYLNPNNSYSFNDSIYIEENSLRFDSLIINDFYGKTAVVGGRIYHENFKNWQLDLDIWANKFMIMNTTEAQNSLYYGRAFITGRINIFGYVDQNIQVDASVKTDKSVNIRNKKIEYTQFNIPLSGPSEVSESTFISFVDKKNPTPKTKGKDKVDLSGFTLNLDLEMTPDAEIQILFDPKVGDVIKSRGEGNLRMEITSNGKFNMFGDYNITDGEYLFTLQNIINKKFRVEKGSSIKWTGSPYNADIDLAAVYEVRTSLQVMFPDDSSGVYRRRYPVNCVLKMSDDLMKPDITFDVDLPTVDASVSQTVKGYLNTEMEMNRQIFSLLVLNTFVTPQSLVGFSDVHTNTNVVGVTGFEMLSNQLSNMLSQVSTEFDLRVNYRPGDDISRDQLEVALSKHLFNDRLVIDGSVANNGTTSQGQSSNAIVGEVNAEYKLTDDGKVRVKAFNRANDNTVINLDAPYTQGVGIFYREDFETISELYKRYMDRFSKENKKTPKKGEG
jgi:hypothetical protein